MTWILSPSKYLGTININTNFLGQNSFFYTPTHFVSFEEDYESLVISGCFLHKLFYFIQICEKGIRWYLKKSKSQNLTGRHCHVCGSRAMVGGFSILLTYSSHPTTYSYVENKLRDKQSRKIAYSHFTPIFPTFLDNC